MITEDGRALCSGGVYAAIDISLYLVEKLCGHEVAVETSQGPAAADAQDPAVGIFDAAAFPAARRRPGS